METSVESSFSSTPAPSRFSPRNVNHPASKSNTRQTERLMLLLVAFNRRSIGNPSANRHIIFEKCSFRSNQHPQPGFRALRTVTLFAPPWLDAFFSIIQSAWSNSVTANGLSGCRSNLSLTEQRFSKQCGTKYLVVINYSWCDAVTVNSHEYSTWWKDLAQVNSCVDLSWLIPLQYFLNDIKHRCINFTRSTSLSNGNY